LDGKRFDDISRALATTSRRRSVVKATAAGALGLLGLSTLRDGASAVGCKTSSDCGGRKVCNSRKICVQCVSNSDCKSGKKCQKKKEKCKDKKK
jgi:Cys-rich repeat protein